MLSWLRASKGGIFFKLVAGFIIFGLLFGMTNMLDRKESTEVVLLEINDTKINETMLLNQLARQTGYLNQTDWNLHSEAGRASTVAILKSLAVDELLDQEVAQLELRAPDQVVQSVLRDAFYNETLGFFDRQKLEATRAALRMTEASYLEFLRKKILHEQLLSTVSNSLIYLPDELVTVWYNFMTSKHQVHYLVLENEDLVGKNIRVNKAQLKQFYLDHQELFIEDEKRSFRYFAVQRGELSNRDFNVLVNDLEVAAADPKVDLELLAKQYGQRLQAASWSKTQISSDEPLKLVADYVFSLNKEQISSSRARLVNNLSRNTYWLVKVDELAPRKVFEFAAVTEKAKELWRSEQLQKLAHQKAVALAEKITTAQQFARLGGEKQQLAIARGEQESEDISDELRAFLFGLEFNKAQVLETKEQQIIALKTAILLPKEINKQLASSYRSQLLTKWSQDLRELFIRSLAQKAEIVVHEASLSKYLQDKDINQLKVFLLQATE